MVYLIGQLAAWLLLTAAFAALAGWSFAAYRAASEDAKARRERAHLLRDFNALIGEGAHPEESVEVQREREAARRMADVREGRIVELEHALETARSGAGEAQARAAELQRALDALEADRDAPHAIAVEVEPAPAAPVADLDPEDDPSLQTWRLRYFEQRVRYLENGQPESAPAPEPVAPSLEPPMNEWRARVAEARAAHAENEVRALMTAPPPDEAADEAQVSPFAANADVDVLLRWRMLYLERRVAHMRAKADAAEPAPQALADLVADPDGDADNPDRWKWRARYLESRARHLEQRLADAAARPAVPIPLAASIAEAELEEQPPAPLPSARRVKPPVLQAARLGAPDDFTLIEGVSLLQQTTLYALGVFHYDQVAAWTDENVAWIDHYLRLRGRIDTEEWRAQADALAREGPAARRTLVEEDA